MDRYAEAFHLEFALGGIWFIGDFIPEISDFLDTARDRPARIVRGADLTDAYIIIERWQSGNTLHQTLDLYIPDRVHMTADTTLVMDHVPPITPPERYLTLDEFYERILDAMMDGFDIPDLDIVYDLTGLTLFDHDLSGSSFLEAYILKSVAGMPQEVTVISGGDLHLVEPGRIFWDAWAIEFYYTLVPGNDVGSVVTDFFAQDYNFLFEPHGAQLNTGPLRISADNQTAALGLSAHIFDMPIVYLYLAEIIPDSGYVLSLEFVFFMDLFGAQDFDILDELSTHMGIDLAEYIATLFDEAF